jgi:hypothetical protein
MKRTARMIVEVVYDDEQADPPGAPGATDPASFAWEPDVSDWHPRRRQDDPRFFEGVVSEGEVRVVEIIDPGLFDGETWDGTRNEIREEHTP